MKRFFDWKDLGAAISLGNLWFITFWKQLIYSPDHHYYDFEPHSAYEYLAVFINVLFLTFIFFSLLRLSNLVSNIGVRRALQAAFCFLALCAFGALSSEIIKWFSPQTINLVNLPLPFIILCFCLVFSAKQKFGFSSITANLKLFVLFLLPFSFLICLQLASSRFITDPKLLLPQSVEKDLSNESSLSKKIVWIIFDELDYAALSTAKQNNIRLPAFERLMSESFVAQNALPPHNYTLKSIPALLIGRPFGTAVPISSNDLKLEPSNKSEPFTLRNSDHIFTETENLGGRNAVVGWYHPYTRIFQERISYGYWHPFKNSRCLGLNRLANCSVNIFIDSFLSVPFVVRFFPALWTKDVVIQNDARNWQLERNRFLADKATELITNPKLNLLFFHFSVPHTPAVAPSDLKGEETYFTSLEVADETIKRLRESLEKTNQWNDTILIVSSDHHWRYKELKYFEYLPKSERQKAVDDLRVPFIVKFAKQKNLMEYDSSFNTIITKEMIMEVFREKIKNADDLAAWLDNQKVTQPELINLQPDIVKPSGIEFH